MNKIIVHLRAPCLSLSGYGGHSRMLLDYLLSDERFVVCLENINWGGCPAIHEQDLADKETIKRYYGAISNYEQAQQVNQQYHISIQVTIPNEFSRRAQVNIGVTAGIEVDRCTHAWIRKCNEMDLIIVPSKFSAEILVNTVYQVENKSSGEKRLERIEKPIHIIPEWFNRPKTIATPKFSFSTKKNLLFVGLWGNKGGFGEDRKNIFDLIRIFLDENKDNPDVGLVLKTSIITNSPEDLHHTKEKIKQIKANFPDVKCKIHLIHQALSENDMWGLYSHPQIQGFVSLTHGEGFGLPLLEAAASGLPVIAANWSGHVDFLREKNGFLPVKFDLVEIPECQHWDGVMERGSRWAKPDEQDVRRRIKKFVESSSVVQKAAKDNVAWLDENFSKDAVMKKWKGFFDDLLQMSTSNPDEGDDERVVAAKRHEAQVLAMADKVRQKYKIEKTDKRSAIYMMPRSFGDCVISTAVIDSLINTRHLEDDFYIATSPEYKEIFKNFEDGGAKIIEWDDILMNDEISRRVWDYVYNPTVNIQYQFSNWTLGNGEFGVRLLEEFAKHCNVYPKDIIRYNIHLKECSLPKKQFVSITPVSLKQSKDYKYWDDVVFNLKKMANIEVVQLGDKREELLSGVLDYRGRTFNETMFIVSRSILHISPDTGTAHAAAALGVPHIALFGSTSYNQCAPVTLQSGINQVVIDSDEACSPRCYKDVCCKMKDGKNCLSQINPETVCAEAYKLISGVKTGKTKLPVLRVDKQKAEEDSRYWFENNDGTIGEIHEFMNFSKDNYDRYINGKFEEL